MSYDLLVQCCYRAMRHLSHQRNRKTLSHKTIICSSYIYSISKNVQPPFSLIMLDILIFLKLLNTVQHPCTVLFPRSILIEQVRGLVLKLYTMHYYITIHTAFISSRYDRDCVPSTMHDCSYMYYCRVASPQSMIL